MWVGLFCTGRIQMTKIIQPPAIITIYYQLIDVL